MENETHRCALNKVENDCLLSVAFGKVLYTKGLNFHCLLGLCLISLFFWVVSHSL